MEKRSERILTRLVQPVFSLVILLVIATLFDHWFGLPTVMVIAQSPGPLPCVRAAVGDPQPWVHNSRVLRSFPPDIPRPRFLGRFATADSQYELHLWRDAVGIFGELLSPVLDADSPTSRLYDTRFDPKSGALSFTAFSETRAFDGRLRSQVVSGRIVRGGKVEAIVLRKVRPGLLGQALQEGVTSRAQFECSMTLFHNY